MTGVVVTTVVLVLIGVVAVAAGTWATVVVAGVLMALGEWSDRANVDP